ncbi:MAG: hypothetical protein U5L73_13560 [Rhodoferax sp.]|uniref:hypothetical protein n=1 Tax=Rhodoferax sp. TaxID=50421 RepID=UPI002ACE63FA|nr:hypothetical protein [Rhodoferax sp.]MDZ7892770.1 hypothetical protein [Rhodoferax sp.]
MRACLLALLLLFCLPLQWAGAASGVPCVHEACAPLHTSLTDVSTPAVTDAAAGEAHAQHPHCGSCHTGAMAMTASAPFLSTDDTSCLLPGPNLWTEVLLIERPERPQWPALF